MMTALGIIAILLTLSLLMWEHIYFKAQRLETQKYPFFSLRDKVLLALLKSDKKNDTDEIWETYTTVNSVIQNLTTFNFRFFSSMLDKYINKIVKDSINNDFHVDKSDSNHKKQQLDPYKKEFLLLVLQTAKENSFYLRMAMTGVGYRLFRSLIFLKVLNLLALEIIKRNNEVSQNRVSVLSNYSELNHIYCNA